MILSEVNRVIDALISYVIAGVFTAVIVLLWSRYIRKVDLAKEFGDQVWWKNVRDILMLIVFWPGIIGLMVGTTVNDWCKKRDHR